MAPVLGLAAAPVMGAISKLAQDPAGAVQTGVKLVLTYGGIGMGLLAVRGWYMAKDGEPRPAPYQAFVPATSGGKSSSGGGSAPSGKYQESWSKGQVAKWMAKAARSRGIPGELPVITALVETGLRNLSGGDRDSAGYFQQRPSQGWGTLAQVTDPNYSLNKFLETAEQYKGQYPNTAVGLGNWAQRVQRSAFPGKYAKRYKEAQRLIGSGLQGTP